MSYLTPVSIPELSGISAARIGHSNIWNTAKFHFWASSTVGFTSLSPSGFSQEGFYLVFTCFVQGFVTPEGSWVSLPCSVFPPILLFLFPPILENFLPFSALSAMYIPANDEVQFCPKQQRKFWFLSLQSELEQLLFDPLLLYLAPSATFSALPGSWSMVGCVFCSSLPPNVNTACSKHSQPLI